jgi:cell division protein FtsX
MVVYGRALFRYNIRDNKDKHMNKVLVFIIGFPIALVMIIYRQKIVAFTGKLEWAEQKLGIGGTYTLVVILALIVWIGCMMYALGSFDQLFGFLKNFY